MENKILSFNNPQIKTIKKLLSSPKFRQNEKKFIIEGARLCLDAYLSNVKLLKIYFTNKAANRYNEYLSDIFRNVDKVLVSETVIKHISNTESPQGIICVCEMMDEKTDSNNLFNSNKILALENIQDPSNLGTVIRTAEALGINSIVLSKECCDIYNPKVLRGSMGSIFRVSFLNIDDFGVFINKLNDSGFITYASVPTKNAISITDVNFKNKCAVFIGNEGNGLNKETIDLCSQKITIPMSGRAESINAAAAANIIMWEMVR